MTREYQLQEFDGVGLAGLEGGLILSEAIIRDQLLEEVLRRLPDRERFVVKCLILSNKTQAFIASRLHVSQPRVNQIKNRAIKRMAVICRNLPQLFDR